MGSFVSELSFPAYHLSVLTETLINSSQSDTTNNSSGILLQESIQSTPIIENEKITKFVNKSDESYSFNLENSIERSKENVITNSINFPENLGKDIVDEYPLIVLEEEDLIRRNDGAENVFDEESKKRGFFHVENDSLSKIMVEQIILEAPEEFRSCEDVVLEETSSPAGINEIQSVSLLKDDPLLIRDCNNGWDDSPDCYTRGTMDLILDPSNYKTITDSNNDRMDAPTLTTLKMDTFEDNRYASDGWRSLGGEGNNKTTTITKSKTTAETTTSVVCETSSSYDGLLLLDNDWENKMRMSVSSNGENNENNNNDDDNVDDDSGLSKEEEEDGVVGECVEDAVVVNGLVLTSESVWRACACCVGDWEQDTSNTSIAPRRDDDRCARASRCSRVPTVWTSPTSSRQNSFENSCAISDKTKSESVNQREDESNPDDPDLSHLKWEFKNGRLVFSENNNENNEKCDLKYGKISSSSFFESFSPLIYRLTKEQQQQQQRGLSLREEKEGDCSSCTIDTLLKCGKNVNNNNNKLDVNIIDNNQNVIYKSKNCLVKDISGEDQDEVDYSCNLTGVGGCEFDVQKLSSFKDSINSDDFYVVYDEYDEIFTSSSSSSEDNNDSSPSSSLIKGTQPDTPVITMGTDDGGDNKKTKRHNPDHDNLRSLLKKPGGGGSVGGRGGGNGGGGGGVTTKHRVVFNENKNEFFDADYIILIREECDYDDEDEDSVCTCNDHEMVRLTCCEPNCNCAIYESYPENNTPPSPKFAPPFEFVDSVTLSPPEGYKDMELGEHQLIALQHMAANRGRSTVCKDCSQNHQHDNEIEDGRVENESDIESDQENGVKDGNQKMDQSQQTTPTTPPDDTDYPDVNCFLDKRTMNDQKRCYDFDNRKSLSQEERPNVKIAKSSKISGILKGGRLWKQQQNQENDNNKTNENQTNDSNSTSDEENNGGKRSVRFTEINDLERDNCDGASDRQDGDDESIRNIENNSKSNNISPEPTEMMLTFKLGNHLLVTNNSLKPNSAMRQLFPSSKPIANKDDNEQSPQYLVTSESLRAFEEAKKAKLPQIIQSDETDDSIKKAIERNTLRRSLIKYEPRNKRKEQKPDNSLVERIKQLTCDVDENTTAACSESEISKGRLSPTGEESSLQIAEEIPTTNHKSFSSSSSSSSSQSSSGSSTYKKLTDLFVKKDKIADIQIQNSEFHNAPDGVCQNNYHQQISKVNSNSESRKQFLSSLAPLTACVGGFAIMDDQHYRLSSHDHPGLRTSVTSSVGTEYSLEDIDEGLKNGEESENNKRVTPDVVAGTPSNETADELAIFVQQDASRIERIKKKYQTETEEEDEHDDYGFNKRPSVRGIKPKFSTTTEILQQIQNHMQASPTPVKVSNQMWPYYSETSLSNSEIKPGNINNQSYPPEQFNPNQEDVKCRSYQNSGTVYQNCINQQCNRDTLYRSNINHVHPVMRIGSGCSEIYQKAGEIVGAGAGVGTGTGARPESPPPLDMARSYHQTMVYIPYNHLENYQVPCLSPNTHYITNASNKCYPRNYNQNQINGRYSEIYQKTVNYTFATDGGQYPGIVYKQGMKAPLRVPFSSNSSRSESPVSSQSLTARSTQTPCNKIASCGYYPSTISAKFRPAVAPGNSVQHSNYESRYGNGKIGSRVVYPDNGSFTDSDSQYSGQMPTIYRHYVETTFPAQADNVAGSPTKQRFIERGIPEGAASVPSQDSTSSSQSTMTSPTSPQQNVQSNPPKPMFYAMNV